MPWKFICPPQYHLQQYNLMSISQLLKLSWREFISNNIGNYSVSLKMPKSCDALEQNFNWYLSQIATQGAPACASHCGSIQLPSWITAVFVPVRILHPLNSRYKLCMNWKPRPWGSEFWWAGRSPIKFGVFVVDPGLQEVQRKKANSLTWAGSIHEPEGGWPRGACFIALRAGWL